MGLIHTRASKKRDKAEATLLKTQAEGAEAEQDRDKPWYQQKTTGAAIGAVLRDRKNKKAAEPDADVEEIAAQMRKLTALHEAGVLTDAEFETRRQALIEAADHE